MSITEPLMRKSESVSKEIILDDCTSKLMKLKQMNDALQMNIGGDLDAEMQKIIKTQKKNLQTEITQIKDYVTSLEKRARTQQQKQKVKKIRTECFKEIERYGQIMKQVVNTSFTNSMLSNSNVSDRNSFVNHNIDLNTLVDSNLSGRKKNDLNQISLQEMNTQKYDTDQQNTDTSEKQYSDQVQQDIEKQQSQALLQEQIMKQQNQIQEQKQYAQVNIQEIQHEADFNESVQKEQQEAIDQIEREVLQMKGLMDDMGEMVVQAQPQIDQIIDDLENTKQNAQETTKEMTAAQKFQKDNKCTIYIILAVVFVGLVIGIIALCGGF